MNTKTLKIKPEAKKRLILWAKFHDMAMSEIAYRCFKAYAKRLPDLEDNLKGNSIKFRSSNLALRKDRMPDVVRNMNSFMLNQIILWWTTEQGTYPPEEK